MGAPNCTLCQVDLWHRKACIAGPFMSTAPLHASAGERLTVLETPTEFFHALLVSAAQHLLIEMQMPLKCSSQGRQLLCSRARSWGLQDGIAKARQRITIASLYIGTDAGREAELVSALAAACAAADRQELQVTACAVGRGCCCRLCCCAVPGRLGAQQCRQQWYLPMCLQVSLLLDALRATRASRGPAGVQLDIVHTPPQCPLKCQCSAALLCILQRQLYAKP